MEKHHRRVFLLRNTAVEQPPRQNNVGECGGRKKREKQRESLVVGHLRVTLSHVVSVASFPPTGSLVASWCDIRNDERRTPSAARAARWTLGVCRRMMDTSTRTMQVVRLGSKQLLRLGSTLFAPTLVTVALHVWPKTLIMCEMTGDELALKLEPCGQQQCFVTVVVMVRSGVGWSAAPGTGVLGLKRCSQRIVLV